MTPDASLRRLLLTELMMQAPYQPATNYWRCIEIAEILQYGFPNGKGLDLGCGDGHLMGIILRRAGSRDLVGLDVDPAETALASERNLYREVVTMPGDRLPFADGTFDYVFSNSVLEHIDAIDLTLGEVSRVSKPGGRFLFTVPGPDFHACLRVPASVQPAEYWKEVDSRCAHLRYWSVEEWGEHLQRVGISTTDHREYLAEPEVQRWDQIARNTSGILYRFVKRKKQPIQIQRQFGLRSPRVRLPKVLAAAAARWLDSGKRTDASRYGCLLVEGIKT